MITKSAQNTSNLTKGLTFTRSARSAWKLIIESVAKEHGHASILLPAYIGFTEREGSGIFDPVEATKAEYNFYSLNEDLSINFESFSELIGTGEYNIAFVVHYFGFCRNNVAKIKSLCKANNVIFVEDCAHAFQLGLRSESLGIMGDFSIYSLHKHLPTDTGGILRDLSRSTELLALPDEDKISYDASLQLLNSDLEAIAAKRRDNFIYYSAALEGVDGLQVMYTLNEDEVPQTFPVRVKNKLREPLYFYLMEKQIPTIALYYRLIDNLDANSYPLSHTISREILNLPVHQDITQDDTAIIMREMKKFMEGRT